MTFEELLDQAIALLQRSGRLTYRALKRQFDLDDDYLEDLKAELIQGQRLAVDEDGGVLVWTGDTVSVVVPAAPALPSQDATAAGQNALNNIGRLGSRTSKATLAFTQASNAAFTALQASYVVRILAIASLNFPSNT
jgi:hypothetical protein